MRPSNGLIKDQSLQYGESKKKKKQELPVMKILTIKFVLLLRDELLLDTHRYLSSEANIYIWKYLFVNLPHTARKL